MCSELLDRDIAYRSRNKLEGNISLGSGTYKSFSFLDLSFNPVFHCAWDIVWFNRIHISL